MTFSRGIFLTVLVCLIGMGGFAVYNKKKKPDLVQKEDLYEAPLQIVKPAPPPVMTLPPEAPISMEEKVKPLKPLEPEFPAVDRIQELFTTGPDKLPIVETVKYSSRVPWIKGRPAWIADYANYYATSRHFIARSLNKGPDYLTQKVTPNSYFNVFRKDKNFNFYALVDLSRCSLSLYYIDLDTQERVLLKTYRVGVGRLDTHSMSGSTTPMGKYLLGSKVAIYKPGTKGLFQEKETEMVTVFGTRWIPFEKALTPSSPSPKGYGIHGVPWFGEKERLKENVSCIGKYDSDGCIRLLTDDVEEFFAIVITKPTIIDIVKDRAQAQLPGKEIKPSLRKG